jgi:3-hydroxyisobutyrate dehydrogenase
MIALFGTGLLGSGFVRALRKRGETVQVWNRTASKAKELEAYGAKAFDEPAEAARGATRLHLTLSDDAAVDETLERARPGIGRDAALVDHTTTSPTGTAARAARWAERGVAFQHAPVFMGPQNALESTGIMLASGDQARYAALSPELAKMTGKLLYLGPQPNRAAAFKLFGNMFLMCMTAGIVDVLALGKALGLEPRDVATIFDSFNPASTLSARVGRILEGDFSHPSWELSMARKDARLMLDEAKRGNVALTLIPALADAMDRFIASGHGKDDWTVLAKDVVGR